MLNLAIPKLTKVDGNGWLEKGLKRKLLKDFFDEKYFDFF